MHHTPEQVDAALLPVPLNAALKMCSRCQVPHHRSKFGQRLESKDGLSFWCRASDKRNWRNNPKKMGAEFPPDAKLPRPDLQCPQCAKRWSFETDRNGCAVQVCGCGRRFVPVLAAPPVERKPVGKRVGA